MRVNLYRRKGETRYWQAQVYIGGKRYRFSCQTDDKETAREYARQQIAELKARHNRGLIGLPEPVRMSQVFERYEREYAPRLRSSSRKRMQTVLEEALSWFKRRTASRSFRGTCHTRRHTGLSGAETSAGRNGSHGQSVSCQPSPCLPPLCSPVAPDPNQSSCSSRAPST